MNSLCQLLFELLSITFSVKQMYKETIPYLLSIYQYISSQSVYVNVAPAPILYVIHSRDVIYTNVINNHYLTTKKNKCFTKRKVDCFLCV